jgi:hypothetical protein
LTANEHLSTIHPSSVVTAVRERSIEQTTPYVSTAYVYITSPRTAEGIA